MNEQIGEMAGRIWNMLDSGGEMTLAQAKKKIGGDEDLFHFGLGWLAREGKINIEQKGRSVKLSLK